MKLLICFRLCNNEFVFVNLMAGHCFNPAHRSGFLQSEPNTPVSLGLSVPSEQPEPGHRETDQISVSFCLTLPLVRPMSYPCTNCTEDCQLNKNTPMLPKNDEELDVGYATNSNKNANFKKDIYELRVLHFTLHESCKQATKTLESL